MLRRVAVEIMAQNSAYFKAKETCIRVDKAGCDSSVTPVTVDDAEAIFPHLPHLLDNLGEHTAPNDVAWVISVQIDFHRSIFYGERAISE
jgi:hypothetical protein